MLDALAQAVIEDKVQRAEARPSQPVWDGSSPAASGSGLDGAGPLRKQQRCLTKGKTEDILVQVEYAPCQVQIPHAPPSGWLADTGMVDAACASRDMLRLLHFV